ncbi:MAG: hotdog fold thioesterase [Actinomycetota bacterium]|nr:hotdog fold thioesterase [Actinomycetota bacterium]
MTERPEQPDAYAGHLAISVVAVGPGWARAAVEVSPRHENMHGTAHGGLVFSVADAALQAASNSHGPTAVATSVAINYVRPASVGDSLLAEALEEHVGGRLGLYRIEVRRASDGAVIALATGQVSISRPAGQTPA